MGKTLCVYADKGSVLLGNKETCNIPGRALDHVFGRKVGQDNLFFFCLLGDVLIRMKLRANDKKYSLRKVRL